MKKKYSKLVLTNDLELYIISLEKAKNSTKNKKDILEKLLKTNLSIEQIIEITGFTAAEIEKLKK